MLGESIETSAGDPKRAGESIREVGINPLNI
jgi:phosphoenolpyruvate carboxykinase (ATP)